MGQSTFKMQGFNPIYLFLGFQILIILAKFALFPEYSNETLTSDLQEALSWFGWWGYILLIGVYVVSAFFFFPILIVLNILSGALYGPYAGTVLSISGITLGSLAAAVSVRHVFKGMQVSIEKNPRARKTHRLLSEYGEVMVLIVRLAFIIPYSLQNIVLALANMGLVRLGMLTFLGALPGAAAYSLIGAGFMQMNDVRKAGAYIGMALVILVGVCVLMKYLRRKYDLR